MFKELRQWIEESLGPGIPEPEAVEDVVTDSIREFALSFIAKDGNDLATKAMLAFHVDAEKNQKLSNVRIRRLEMHWIFRRATIGWVSTVLALFVLILFDHATGAKVLYHALQWITGASVTP